MKYSISDAFPDQMLLEVGGPCLSIYMTTHKLKEDQKKDILVFKNLAKEAIASLELMYAKKEIKQLARDFKDMELDDDLWNYASEGLALFATLEKMIIYRLDQSMEPLAIVSNSFHIKPLIEYYQAIENFNVLALEAESFTLFQGNHYVIKPITFEKGAQTTLVEVLGGHHTENYKTHGTYGGASDGSTFHGHGGRPDEVELDRAKFFKYVDRYVHEFISNVTKLPLVLVAHGEHHHGFKSISNNPYLLDSSVSGSMNSMKLETLQGELKKINDDRFHVVVGKSIETYHNVHHQGLSSDQVIIVLKALLNGRVDILMIEKNKIIPGNINFETQQIISNDLNHPETDDLLDDMVQQALLMKTTIYILDPEHMPTTSGIAAIFRY